MCLKSGWTLGPNLCYKIFFKGLVILLCRWIFWEFNCWAITQLSWVNYVNNRLVLHPNDKSEMFLKEPKWLQHWPITPGLFLAVPKKKKMGRCCHHQARCGLVQYPRMRRCRPLGREPTTKSKKKFSLRSSKYTYTA